MPIINCPPCHRPKFKEQKKNQKTEGQKHEWGNDKKNKMKGKTQKHFRQKGKFNVACNYRGG